MTAIPLLKTRTIMHRTIDLKESKIDPQRKKLVENFLKQQVKELLNEAEKANDQKVKTFQERFSLNDVSQTDLDELTGLPLIRLKIEYTGGYSCIHSGKFAEDHVPGLLANPDNFFFFYKRKDH